MTEEEETRRQFFRRMAAGAARTAVEALDLVGQVGPRGDRVTEPDGGLREEFATQFRMARERAGLEPEAFAAQLREDGEEEVTTGLVEAWETGLERIPPSVYITAQFLGDRLAGERGDPAEGEFGLEGLETTFPKAAVRRRLEEHVRECGKCPESAVMTVILNPDELDPTDLCPEGRQLHAVYSAQPLHEA